MAKRLREQGKTIATINGAFDLFHAGHVFMLFEAKKQADILFVALNTDASIQRYKGKQRPIQLLQHRLEVIAAIESVDFVTFFDEDDPREFLKQVRPDIHVNGAEYGVDCIEAPTLREIGARLFLLPRIGTLASSEMIAKIQGASCV